MLSPAQSKQFITELIRRQMVLLGSNLALDTANRVEGIEVDSIGSVRRLQGEPILIIESLIKEFQKLSPQVTNAVVSMQFIQFPEVKAELTQPLPHVKLTCLLSIPR